MVYVTLRFDGLPAEILEEAVRKGLGKTKSEVVRMGLLKLNEQYQLLNDEGINGKEIQLMEDLIEKSIKTGRIVSEAELFATVK